MPEKSKEGKEIFELLLEKGFSEAIKAIEKETDRLIWGGGYKISEDLNIEIISPLEIYKDARAEQE